MRRLLSWPAVAWRCASTRWMRSRWRFTLKDNWSPPHAPSMPSSTRSCRQCQSRNYKPDHPPASTTSSCCKPRRRVAMFETYFGFKKVPFSDEPDAKQLFEHAGWKQVRARLKFLIDHCGAGLLTGEVGSGKSTAARTWLAGLNPNLFKVIYLHWSSGSSLDLLRQIARGLDLEPAHFRGDLTGQI